MKIMTFLSKIVLAGLLVTAIAPRAQAMETAGAAAAAQVQPNTLAALFADMNYYKIEDRPGKLSSHMFDLLGHSLAVGQWLEFFMQQEKGVFYLDSKDPIAGGWYGDFSKREKQLLALAGYLHDIGKAGDITCKYFSAVKGADGRIEKVTFTDKKDHESIGLRYLLGIQEYKTVAGNVFNFAEFFKDLGLTQDEAKLIAILTGAHKLFTSVYSGSTLLDLFGAKAEPTSIAQFHADLKELIITHAESTINPTKFDKLIRMIVALTMADMLSVFFKPERVFSDISLINCLDEEAFSYRRPFAPVDATWAFANTPALAGDAAVQAYLAQYKIALGEPQKESDRRTHYVRIATMLALEFLPKVLA